METSPDIGALAGALSKAQAEIKGATKDSDNPFFKSKYADLASVWEACRTALTNHGIAVMQGPSVENATLSVTTLLVHSSGQWARSVLSTTLKDHTPQVVGSATTYLRRYGLAAMAGVAPHDDDDGNAAQGNAGGLKSRAEQRDAARAANAREAAEHGPYAERERQRAIDKETGELLASPPKPPTAAEAATNRYAKLREQMKAWPPEIAAIIPPDEALFTFPEPEAETNRAMYLEGIRYMVASRKFAPKERAELRMMFFGSPTADLDTANVYELRALWKFLDLEKNVAT